MRTIRQELLEEAFPAGVPPLIAALLPPGWDPASFAAGPIFSSDGAGRDGPRRFYVADNEDLAAWTAALLEAAPGAADLLRAAPPGTRRMADIGEAGIDVYLDDLQLGGESSVMCAVHHHPSGARSEILLLEAPRGLGALAPAWGEGRIARRVGARQSLLWISEAKHTGRVAEVEALAARMFRLPPAYLALKARHPEVYIDGLELHPDGRIDLTPGFR